MIRADDLPIRIQPGSAVAKGLAPLLKKAARAGAPLKIAAAGYHGRRIIQYALDENPAPARQWVARRFQGGAKGFALLDGHQRDLDAVADIRAEVEAEVRRLIKRMGGGEERMQLEFPEVISHRTPGGRVLYASGWTGGGLIRLAWTLGGDRGRAAADVVATAAHEFNDALLWDALSDFHRKRATFLAETEWLKDESIAARVKKSLAASGETGDADAEAREAFSYALEGYAAGQFKARRSGSFLKKILDGLRALGVYLRGKFSSRPSAEAMFEMALRGDFLKASAADNKRRVEEMGRRSFGGDDDLFEEQGEFPGLDAATDADLRALPPEEQAAWREHLRWQEEQDPVDDAGRGSLKKRLAAVDRRFQKPADRAAVKDVERPVELSLPATVFDDLRGEIEYRDANDEDERVAFMKALDAATRTRRGRGESVKVRLSVREAEMLASDAEHEAMLDEDGKGPGVTQEDKWRAAKMKAAYERIMAAIARVKGEN